VTLVRVLLALAAVAGLALPGCGRDVGLTPGPAGEPEADLRPADLRFTIATDPAHLALAEVYAAQFEALGARVKVEVRSYQDITRPDSSDWWDACIVGWWGPTPDPLGMAVAKLTSAGAENFSGYADPETDLLLSGLLLRAAPEERERAAWTVQEFVHEEVPWVYGVATPLHDAAVGDLTGWYSGPGGSVSLHDAQTAAGEEAITVALGAAAGPRLDPLRPIDPQVGVVFRCLFDALAARAPDGTLVPELAEKWAFSPNARELIVTLREGVTFHNGELLRTGDVVFTYRRFLEGRVPPGVEVTVVGQGERDVVFTFSVPFPTFLNLFGVVPVVPREYYETVGPDGFSAAPVGTGPFAFSGIRGETLVLRRWEEYYGGAPGLVPTGPAPLAEVCFTFVPDNDRRIEALRTGQAALAPALAVEPAEILLPSPEPGGGLKVVREPGWNAAVLELDNTEPPFDDTRLRLALNLAVDSEALLAVASGATILPGAFFAEGFGYTTANTVFVRDEETARALLAEAGYVASEP